MKSGQMLRLKITSTDLDVLRRFRAIMGFGSISGPYKDPKHPTYKPKWHFDIGGGKKAYAAIVALWPYLGNRRRAKAEEAIRFFAAQTNGPKKLNECARGHAFSAENTGHWKRGRYCKECKRLRNADRYNEAHPLRKRGYYKKRTLNVPQHILGSPIGDH